MKRNKPQAASISRPAGLEWHITPQARERWLPEIKAAANTDNTISILDAIGFDPWTGDGVTAKRIAAALRTIGAEKDIVVNINSPGGDLFEGLAIYNLLREHKGEVKVKVLGLAASAASIIAMAGDQVEVARAGFLMIHNTWVITIGDRNDLRDAADMLEPFDKTMAEIYAARSDLELKVIAKMMDRETWIGGDDAVEQGFADSLLPADEVKKEASRRDALPARTLESMLARAGMSRTERRALMNEFKSGMPGAAGTGMPGATEDGTHDAAVAARNSYLDFLNHMEITQ